ncbi:MAG: mechanosensitive ion channel [Chitinivibrionales bacterium]|nr:mechanosensitive ion channel [Chitinivibrionales bacterium]
MSTFLAFFDPLKQRALELSAAMSEFVGQQRWAAIFAIIFCTIAFERLSQGLLKLMLKLTGRTRTDFDDRLVGAMARPAGNYVLLFGLFLVVNIFTFPEGDLDLTRILMIGVKLAVIVNTLWLIWRLIDEVGSYLVRHMVRTNSKLDDHLAPILQKSMKVFVLVIGALYIIQALGYSVSGLLAGLGIGGLAVAMAAKDTLANLFGSVMILMDRPFKVGDWIKSGDDEGVVEEIGFRSTRIRTFPKTLITIPNSAIANTSVNNFTRMPKRRVKMTVGVTYETTAEQMDALVEGIRAILREHSEVNQEFSLVNFTDFGSSSLDVLVYYFTTTTDWAEHLRVRQEVNLAIMRLVERMGLSIAFPTRTVYLRNDNSPDAESPLPESEGSLLDNPGEPSDRVDQSPQGTPGR